MANDMETVYKKPKFWRKGNRVSDGDDSLRIPIGGDNNGAKKPRKQANRIVSTKYNAITFLPQNLFEQFRRIANFYFLVMTIIALSIDSPVSPLTSLVPLVFVITVTAAKQGYEDFLRYRADNMVNLSMVSVIRNGIETDIRCEDIHPGDLVKIPRDCDVPCDLILLASSENGKCFITTANLDGETNLKTLVVPKGLPEVIIEKLHTLGTIECEFPRTDLYTFNGRIELPSTMNRISVIPTDMAMQAGFHNIPLMAENLMLRGARVKNTQWAIACAVYTGQNTKLALNSKITRNKMSSSERYINKYLVFFILLLLGVVTVSYFIKRYYDMLDAAHDSYLGYEEIINEVSQFFQDYFSFLILFNYLIPISLYVTIEMQKFIGSFFMEWDPHLYDEETNQPCIVNTSDLNEELGQINILFSDKTGTLTKNLMVFKECSINGKMYSQKGRGLQEVKRNYSLKIGECSKFVYTFFEALAICHTVQVAGKYLEDEDEADEINSLLNVSNEIPEVFQESLEEETNVPESDGNSDETDFISITPKITNSHLRNGSENEPNGHSILDETRPFSEQVVRRLHLQNLPNRPLSLTEGTMTPNVSVASFHADIAPKKNVDFAIDPALQKKIQSLQFKRTISHNEEISNVTEAPKHRRTQSNVQFGSSAPTMSTIKPSFLRNTADRTSTREYYAAPAYNTASLLERNESVLGQKLIESFIDKLDYQASSPDEKALVEACARLGLIYLNDNNDIYTIRLRVKKRMTLEAANNPTGAAVDDNSDIVQFKRLQVLEFTSDRKRMSVIVMDRNGQIWIYTKGAESHVLPLCSTGSSNIIRSTQEHIDGFAKLGLRTLAVARRKITKAEFINFNNELIEANSCLTDRIEKVQVCQRKIETGLDLLGATAVEDALQDNVKDTLESIRAAGVKVWVLTGDKVETALNISLSCGHIPKHAAKYFITECRDEIQLTRHLEAFESELQENEDTEYALLIDGSSLAVALDHAAVKFRDLALKCHAVLCCRLSPLQKCEVVHLVKTSNGKMITAAIGDGANDVSMIQEAHVGLGIVGKEGRQAARCADYAFANFSMLKRIVLLHGHYFSHRLSLLILYFFYKNLVLMGIQLFFQMNSLFSSQSIYDSLFLTLYNVIYTTLPILFISITEKVHPEEQLMSDPTLYKRITGNKLFEWKYFVGWMLIGLYHSVIIYLFAFLIWTENSTIFNSGKTVNFLCFGTFMIHNVVVLVNLKLMIEAVYKSYIFIGTVWLSIFGFMGTTFVYNLFNLSYDHNLFMVYSNLLTSTSFWALSTLIVVTGLFPDMVARATVALNIKFRTIFPGNIKMGTFKRNQTGPKLVQTTRL